MTALATTLQAFFTDRLARQPSQSEYARRLPGYTAVAAGLCCGQEGQGTF